MRLADNNNFVKEFLLLDGIAILLIVFQHELLGIPGFLDNPKVSIYSIFVDYILIGSIFGLMLFSFSSGAKFGYSHFTDRTNKVFIKTYAQKRFIRLYKPYIGYSILIFFPTLFIIYGINSFFNKRYAQDTLNSLNIEGLINFLLGNNLIASQLWYLYALLIMTIFLLIILYIFKNVYALFFFFIIFTILWFVIPQNSLAPLSFLWIISKVIFFFPVFILGIYYGYFKKINHEILKKLVKVLFMIFLVVLFLISYIVFFESHYFTIYHNYFVFISGTLCPFFLIQFFEYIKKNSFFLKIFSFCGNYSLQIFLLHVPLILPPLNIIFIDVLKFITILTPIIITSLTVVLCIFTYKVLCLLKLNNFFE